MPEICMYQENYINLCLQKRCARIAGRRLAKKGNKKTRSRMCHHSNSVFFCDCKPWDFRISASPGLHLPRNRGVRHTILSASFSTFSRSGYSDPYQTPHFRKKNPDRSYQEIRGNTRCSGARLRSFPNPLRYNESMPTAMERRIFRADENGKNSREVSFLS